MDRNKIRNGDKFQDSGDRKFCRLTSCLVIQPFAIGLLGVIGCFVAIIGTAAGSIYSLCQITERLLFFRISIEPPKRLFDHHSFGHTHHWSHGQSIVVLLHAESRFSRFGLDALIIH